LGGDGDFVARYDHFSNLPVFDGSPNIRVLFSVLGFIGPKKIKDSHHDNNDHDPDKKITRETIQWKLPEKKRPGEKTKGTNVPRAGLGAREERRGGRSSQQKF
jgi:hypothetical protein